MTSAASSTAPSLSSFSGQSSLETSPDTTPPSSPDLRKRSIPQKQEPDDFPSTLPPVPPNALIPDVDEKDAGTPDAWINRDPRIVRLTGKVRHCRLPRCALMEADLPMATAPAQLRSQIGRSFRGSEFSESAATHINHTILMTTRAGFLDPVRTILRPEPRRGPSGQRGRRAELESQHRRVRSRGKEPVACIYGNTDAVLL
jgi:hypothetical protein